MRKFLPFPCGYLQERVDLHHVVAMRSSGIRGGTGVAHLGGGNSGDADILYRNHLCCWLPAALAGHPPLLDLVCAEPPTVVRQSVATCMVFSDASSCWLCQYPVSIVQPKWLGIFSCCLSDTKAFY